MRSIGGYLELELRRGSEYHDSVIRLNSGRNALKYILMHRAYRHVLLPWYACEALYQPVRELGLECSFYHINEAFEPVIDPLALSDESVAVCVNYFGLSIDSIASVVRGNRNVIVDNAQAFFAKPIPGVDTFYSPRKFFGVADGGYAYSEVTDTGQPREESWNHMKHLLVRSDTSAEMGYGDFIANEKRVSESDMLGMSKLTRKLLKGIEYDDVAQKRRANFQILEAELGSRNPVKLALNEDQVPLCYPFYSEDPFLRDRLIEQRIYVPMYWPSILDEAPEDCIERRYAKHLIHLPVDQNLDDSDIQRIVKNVKR